MIRTMAASRWSGLRRCRDPEPKPKPKPKPSMRGKTKNHLSSAAQSRLPLVGPETVAHESTFKGRGPVCPIAVQMTPPAEIRHPTERRILAQSTPL